MQHLEIWIDGRNYAKKGSGFAVVLMSTNNKWVRSFTFGKNSMNISDLLALKFGLLSISNAYNKMPVKIFTKNPYVTQVLEKTGDGYWKVVPKNNVQEVTDVRNLLEGKIFEVNKSEGDIATLCHKCAENAVKNGKIIDLRE